MSDSPHRDHVVVHLLQLLLCRVKMVGRRIQLIGFKAVATLTLRIPDDHLSDADLSSLSVTSNGLSSSCGTFSLSACDDAASVVTDLVALATCGLIAGALAAVLLKG